MGADDDDGAGIFAAGDLGDDVVDLGGGTDAVFEGKVDGDGAGFEEAFDEELVFEADLGDGEGGEFAVETEGAGVLGAVGAAGHEDGFGGEGVDDADGLEEIADGGVFAEAGVVDEDDGAGDFIFYCVEFFDGKELADVVDGAGDAFGGGGGTPTGGVDVEGLGARGEDGAGGWGLGLP